MQNLKTSFEKELIKKLGQKSGGTTTEETLLMRAFKYFDLNNNGVVEPTEFAKAIEKCGIMIPTKQDLDALYSCYDADGNGRLEYREFANQVFGHKINAATPSSSQSSNPDALLDTLRKKLASRGARGIVGLGRQFRIMDDNHSMSLDKYEFTKAMTDYMLGFSEGEIATLFRTFDFDHSGLIEYNEFIRTIRGPMSPYRVNITMQAFAKMDRDGNGWIDINDIKGVYTADKHPDVMSGKKTENQVLQEFLETFELHLTLRTKGTPDHIVTKEEFIEYYNNISCSIDNDEYFSLMMNNAWNLDGSRVTKSGWSNTGGAAKQATAGKSVPGRSFQASGAGTAAAAMGQKASSSGAPTMNYTDAQLLDRFRSAIKKRGARGIQGIGRSFRIADDDRSGFLCVEEFKKCIHDFRVGLNDRDAERLFQVFDCDKQGQISYDEFLHGVRGEMNEFRKGLAMKAFAIMDADSNGQLTLSDIKTKYNAKKDPKVISGEKTEDEVLYEFMDTFETNHFEMKGEKDHIISKEEWIVYYDNVSMSIDDDAYFELMMTNAWNLDNSRVTKKGWGGAY